MGNVEGFEKILLADIVDANNKLQSTNNNAFTRYKELLLDTSGRKEFDGLITSLQKGDFRGRRRQTNSESASADQ